MGTCIFRTAKQLGIVIISQKSKECQKNVRLKRHESLKMKCKTLQGTCLHFTALVSAYHVAALCHPKKKSAFSGLLSRSLSPWELSYHKFFGLHTSKWVGSGQTPRRLPQFRFHMRPRTHLLRFVLRILYSCDHLD